MSSTLPFIGCSMQDLNFGLLLHPIWGLSSRSAYERGRPLSYVYLPRAGSRRRQFSTDGARGF